MAQLKKTDIGKAQRGAYPQVVLRSVPAPSPLKCVISSLCGASGCNSYDVGTELEDKSLGSQIRRKCRYTGSRTAASVKHSE